MMRTSRTILLVVIIALAACLPAGPVVGQIVGVKQGLGFICPVHREVKQPMPGKCSTCGFDLLPASKADQGGLKKGDEFKMSAGAATVKEFDVTRVVENDYSKRFQFDKSENPKLSQLREQEKLAEAVAGGKDEFDRQVRLMDFVHQRIKKFGTPTANPQGALEIFKAVDEGHTFYCGHYGASLVSCAASLGWVNRAMALHVGARATGSGAPEHTSTEIWSNQHNKWVLFDPTYAMYVERDGTPLSGWEVRQEWFYGDPQKLDFVIGKERKKYKKSDMPIFRAKHPGYGDLALGPRTVDKLALMGIIPNTNLMDAGPDYAKMFIMKDDELSKDIQWHKRDNPKNPAVEPYFPLAQADLTLLPWDASQVKVWTRTMTPNFKTFRYRVDGKEWADGGANFNWTLHAGTNTLEAVSVNQFGVEGHPSKVVVEVK
jgi:hypothetical protein